MNIDEIKKRVNFGSAQYERGVLGMPKAEQVKWLISKHDRLTAELATAREDARTAEARGLAMVSEMIRDATNHSSCQDCTVENKMESVHEYIADVIRAEAAKLPQTSAPILCTFPDCDTARALDVAQRAGMMRAAEIAESYDTHDYPGWLTSKKTLRQWLADAIRAEAQALKGEE